MKIPFIGIDPAFRKNGFAMCIIDEDNDVAFHRFASFLDFVRWLWTPGEAPDRAVVVVENSNLDQIMYQYHRSKKGQAMATAARNVGANQAASQYTYDVCRHKWGSHAHEVSPGSKTRGPVSGKAKWTAKDAAILARSYGHALPRTSQDERDAYQLALMAMTRKPKKNTSKLALKGIKG